MNDTLDKVHNLFWGREQGGSYAKAYLEPYQTPMIELAKIVNS